MFKFFAIPAHDRRLIPEGRLSGPMPWVIAIMIFLTVLAAAAGLAMTRATSDVSDQLSSRATVQIIEANPELRGRQAEAAAERLRTLPLIEEVRLLPPEEIQALIEPWLGTQDLAEEIPLPALIDLKLAHVATDAEYQSLRNTLQPIAPGARVEPSSGYIAPVISLVRSFQWIAFGLVALLALATGAAVIISARSALNTHTETIAVVHLLGGTDQQISRRSGAIGRPRLVELVDNCRDSDIGDVPCHGNRQIDGDRRPEKDIVTPPDDCPFPFLPGPALDHRLCLVRHRPAASGRQ